MPDAPTVPTHRVVVTAMGIVSPFGAGLAENLRGLQEGRDCVTPVTRFDVTRTRASTAGQVTLPVPCGKAWQRLHLASRMLIAAAGELRDGDPEFKPELLVAGATGGGMSFGEQYLRTKLRGEHARRRASWLANYLPEKAALDAQEAVGYHAPIRIIANACASGTNAIGHAFALIRGGQYQRILCGGFDTVSEMVFVGFDSLQAATPERIRPFDRDRTGLVLGEGAALLSLEALSSAERRRAPILAEVTGYGVSTDNYHLTQPNPSGIGPRLAMSRALDAAGRRPEEIDYVNAHGTATAFNDATEGLAIAELFGPATAVSSTKSMMGHALGAAGAIEAVFSILALQHQFLPPNINFVSDDPAFSLAIVVNQARAASVNRVLSNSFGFGGANASLVVERPGAFLHAA